MNRGGSGNSNDEIAVSPPALMDIDGEDGEEIVVCAGEKSLRYHFLRSGSSGQLVRISDRYGNTLKVGYNLHGQLERLSNDSGNALAFDFEGSRLTSVRLLRRELTDTGYQWQSLRTERSYTYDDSDDLIGAEDAEGGTERYGYENHMDGRRTRISR